MISIIIPTYNRAHIIGAALDSIVRQELSEWKCYIVDDNSTDNSYEIVHQYILKDDRFVFLKNERKKGAQGARNTGLYYCNSEWLVFFDSDNIMHPDFLLELSKGIRDDVDVVQCYSNVIDIDTKENVGIFNWKSNGYIHNQLFTQQTYIDFNHAIIRRNKVIEIGGLDENCPSMQEWDTHIRLSRVAKYATIERPLIDYFVGGKDAISSDTKREVRGRIYILNKHHSEWRKHKEAYKNFVRQIESYINSNSDASFRTKAQRRLKIIAWDAYVVMFIDQVKGKIRPYYYKLRKCKYN